MCFTDLSVEDKNWDYSFGKDRFYDDLTEERDAQEKRKLKFPTILCAYNELKYELPNGEVSFNEFFGTNKCFYYGSAAPQN